MAPGIYIHIPFCTGRCFYCSFNSIRYDDATASRYVDAVSSEFLSRPPKGQCDSLYIGGGTPTTIAVDRLASLVESVYESLVISPGAEVTVEANPGGLAGYDAGMLISAGVNRFSIGAQSFDPGELRMLGRRHGPEDIGSAVRSLRAAGADNLSLDLIYALPGQDIKGWGRNIDKAIGLGPEHISLYDLSVDEGTPLFLEVASGRLRKPPEELQSEMYLHAVELLEKAGYVRYEISNFALPGRECRHNMNYWAAGEYEGYGAGAYSCMAGVRSCNMQDVGCYIDVAQSGRPTSGSSEALTGEDMRKEFVMLALRTSGGISFDVYETRFGHGFMERYGAVVGRLAREGYISPDGRGIRLTGRGVLASNPVIAEFF